jgi:hypothetical protein
MKTIKLVCNKTLLLATCSFILFVFLGEARADDEKYNRERFTIGANYPGLNLRINFKNNISVEVKAQSMDDIFVVGPRIYSFFGDNIKPLKFFWGGEVDYLSFKGEVSNGSGYALEGFCGLEYFLSKRISFQADIGPAFLMVTDSDTSLNSSGLQFVINSGINFYF